MSRGKVLLIVVPAAVAVGVLITMLFLSSLSDDRDSLGNPVSRVAVSSESYWTGQQAAASESAAASASVPVVSTPASVPPAESVPASSAVSSQPGTAQGQAATGLPTPGGFTEAPTVSVSGNTVSVTFKTATNSTVNSVLVTSPDEMSVSGFYDYFNRGAVYEAAVEKKATFNVGPDGVTETYELPDTGKNYWLLINTVDNESGEWQGSVTAMPIYTV